MMPLTSDIYEDFVDEVELINKPADKTAYVLVISDLNVQQKITGQGNDLALVVVQDSTGNPTKQQITNTFNTEVGETLYTLYEHTETDGEKNDCCCIQNN